MKLGAINEDSTLSNGSRVRPEDGTSMARNLVYEDDPSSQRQFRLEWRNVISIGLLHIGAVAGLALVLQAKVKFLTLIFALLVHILSEFGVTAGVHRYWTHRSYKASTPMRIFLAFCNTLGFSHSIYQWVRDHRLHHKYSDTDADPHNATRGFFFSHIGWLLVKKHPLVLQKGKVQDISDLKADPIVMFQRRYFISLSFVIAFLIPALIPWKLWSEGFYTSFLVCGLLRITIQFHSTQLVNSAAHMWGMKPFDKNIEPCENQFVSFFAIGEGWHNYHHVFPWDYRASEYGSRFNITTTMIDWFAKIGWAYDLKTASEEVMERRAQRHGDGSRSDKLQAEQLDGGDAIVCPC